MARTKKCSSCNELKPTTQFSKHSKHADGLQYHCKQCNKAVNDCRNNETDYHHNYMRSDKDGIIYTIINPIGETYTGSTQTLPNVRWNKHVSAYKSLVNSNEPSTQLLHKSFDMWGILAHEFKVVDNYGQIQTHSLREIESNMIKAYKLNGKSLNIKN